MIELDMDQGKQNGSPGFIKGGGLMVVEMTQRWFKSLVK